MRSFKFLASRPALAVLPQLALPAAEQAPAAAAASAQHERLLPLEGGRNFRDLGGYRTTDGRTVKWGLLFRSGSMHGLTANDFAYLSKLGIVVVCDFRDHNERKVEPVAWPAGRAPTVYAEDYDMATNGMMPIGDLHKMTATQAQEMLATSYPKMLTFFAGQYRRMFAELLAGHAPLAFNCAGGKDRTGVAAALLLTALGVPRETVIEDYLLTNRYLNATALMKQAGPATVTGAFASLSPDVMKALGAADRSYIEAALRALDAHPGGAEGYFRDEMKLSPADIARLRSLYLE